MLKAESRKMYYSFLNLQLLLFCYKYIALDFKLKAML